MKIVSVCFSLIVLQMIWVNATSHWLSLREVNRSEVLDGTGVLVKGEELITLTKSLSDLNEETQSQLLNGLGRSLANARSSQGNYSKGRVMSVIGSAFLILTLSLFGVYLPDLIKLLVGRSSDIHFSSRRRLIESLCNSFAAGGFWGLALVHVLKEAIDDLDRLHWGIHVRGAYCNGAYLLICTGYLAMLAVEAFATTSSHKRHLKRGFPNSTRPMDRKNYAVLDATVASFALTFHAFFEGMVIGMRPSGITVWVATISVAGHKWAEAFALSQRMCSTDLGQKRRILLLSFFLVSTPFGAVVGLPLGAFENSPISGILSSISCGVLIFVAGECTSSIFQPSHHSTDTDADTRPNHHSKDTDADICHAKASVVLESVHISSYTGLSPESLQKTVQCTSSESERSYRLLLGQLSLMISGITLLASMMLVEMKTDVVIGQD